MPNYAISANLDMQKFKNWQNIYPCNKLVAINIWLKLTTYLHTGCPKRILSWGGGDIFVILGGDREGEAVMKRI